MPVLWARIMPGITIGFNTVGIALSTAGFLSPWLAALFHHISSVLVVLNSARLVRDDHTGS